MSSDLEEESKMQSLLKAFTLPICMSYDPDTETYMVFVNEEGYEQRTAVSGARYSKLINLIETSIQAYMREAIPLAKKRSSLK